MTAAVNVASLGTAMSADSSGNVGIGGAATNEGGYSKCLQITGTGGDPTAVLEVKSGASYSYLAQNGTTLQLRNNATAGAMTFATVGTERARIDSSGNVGIGTNNPTQRMVVENSTSETVFQVNNTSTNGKAYEWIAGGSGGNFSGGRFGLYSRTDSTELLSATSNTAGTSGGTTGKGIGFSNAGFWIDRGWGDYPSITVCTNNVSGNTNQAQLRLHGTNASWSSYPSGGATDFSCSMFIDGTYQTGSDRRFKTNITNIEGALAKVMSMTGKRFQTTTRDGTIVTGGTENNYRYGFIAQDLQAAQLDELYKHNIAEDDNTEGYNKAYSVEYDAVVPLLVNAIKEQQALITQLQADVAELKARP